MFRSPRRSGRGGVGGRVGGQGASALERHSARASQRSSVTAVDRYAAVQKGAEAVPSSRQLVPGTLTHQPLSARHAK